MSGINDTYISMDSVEESDFTIVNESLGRFLVQNNPASSRALMPYWNVFDGRSFIASMTVPIL